MKKHALIYIMLFSFLLVHSTSITFRFDNVEFSTAGELEFDVMAKAGDSGTLLGATQVYIEYNTSAFGENIAGTSDLEVTKGALLQGEAAPTFFLYGDPVMVNNADSLLSIQTSNLYGAAFANELPTEFSDLLHFKIAIQDTFAMSEISMNETLMQGQQYESDNSTHYIPIFYENELDIYLRHPEQPIITSIVRTDNSITINWNASEAAGYYQVYSSVKPEGPFLLNSSGTMNDTSWTTSLTPAESRKFYLVKAYN